MHAIGRGHFVSNYFLDKLRDWWKKFSYHMFQKAPSFDPTSANSSEHSFSKGSPSVSLTSLRKDKSLEKSFTKQESFVDSRQIVESNHIPFIR